ncbi:hypothetical protein EI555_006868 [Monodon monoceros]|uniref:Uncharacterized protein n=1 Tax=Monodon monoceros TaxID=40151 RepID=A0A4U1FFR2_MONMO|nr:hypothetical protein EI555_006868 [Monodon monoceros]
MDPPLQPHQSTEAQRDILSFVGSPKEYLETFIFPVLLPGMASLLHQAKKEKCFERKRTKFIACDFLTEWLYKQMAVFSSIEHLQLLDPEFHMSDLVRCDPEIQELRQWQKKLREDKHIRQRVKIFWAKQEQKGLIKLASSSGFLDWTPVCLAFWTNYQDNE